MLRATAREASLDTLDAIDDGGKYWARAAYSSTWFLARMIGTTHYKALPGFMGRAFLHNLVQPLPVTLAKSL